MASFCTLRRGACLVFLSACGASNSELEISGSWVTPWGVETISSDAWQSATVVSFDNASNTAITQMPADDEFNASAFSKVVWTDLAQERFYYCTAAFGLSTQERAQAAEDNSDATDLDGAGCGGFPWTSMRVPLSIAGNYASEFGDESISATHWDNGYAISAVKDWHNSARWVITQAPEDAQHGANTFSTIFWSDADAGSIHYCSIAYNLETIDEALGATLQAPDGSEPDHGGCGDFPWTKLAQR